MNGQDEPGDGEVPIEVAGPGAWLRAARLRAGLAPAQVAERLHLDESVIEALEADRDAFLGAAVYVRGHLRRYAQLLGEPRHKIDALYAARQGLRSMPDLTHIVGQPLPVEARRANLRFWPSAALAALLALACIVWWALEVEPQPLKPVAPSPSGVPAAAASMAAVVARGPVPVGGSAVTRGSAATSAAAARSPPGSTAGVAGDAVKLVLSFRGQSWAEVYDAAGARLFYELGAVGDRRLLSGAAPLRLVLGNPAGVTVALNGMPVVLAAARADVPLRLTLDRSGHVSDLQ